MTVRGWLAAPDSSSLDRAPAARAGVTADAIDEAIASGWLRQRPGSQVIEFTSPHVLHVVQGAQSRDLTVPIRVVRKALLAAVVTAHADHTWDHLDQDVRESLLASVVEQDPEASWELVHGDLAAELFALRRATGRDAASREFLAAIAERLASGQIPAGVLTVATSEALFDAGRLDKAFQLLIEEHNRLLREHGESDPRTLSALHNLAAAYAAAATAAHGHPEARPLYQEARTLYERLLGHRLTALQAAPSEESLAYRRGVPRPDHPRMLVISTRDQYARLLAACYLYPEAIAQGRILLGEQRSALGPHHPDTLTPRSNLATWLGQAGDAAAAARDYASH